MTKEETAKAAIPEATGQSTVRTEDLQKLMQVASVDELAMAVKAQGALGITEFDEFDEGNMLDRDCGLPPWAPLTKRDGTRLHYFLIDMNNFKNDERTIGNKPLAVPVCRGLGDVFADLPDHIFNARGIAQAGDCIVCVSLESTYRKYKKGKMALSDARAQTLQKSQIQATSAGPLGGKVDGSLVSGFGVPVMSH